MPCHYSMLLMNNTVSQQLVEICLKELLSALTTICVVSDLVLPSGSSKRVTPRSLSATPKACSRFSRLVCLYTLPMSMSLGLGEHKNGWLIPNRVQVRGLVTVIFRAGHESLIAWLTVICGARTYSFHKRNPFWTFPLYTGITWLFIAHVLLYSLYFQPHKAKLKLGK